MRGGGKQAEVEVGRRGERERGGEGGGEEEREMGERDRERNMIKDKDGHH